MRLFASPDFGATGAACLVLLVLSAILLVFFAVAVGYILYLLRQPSAQARRRGLTLGLILVTCIVGSWSVWWFSYYKPRRDFESLLAGSRDSEVTSLQVNGQRLTLSLNDPDCMRYLSNPLRSAERDSAEMGLSYGAEVTLSSGGSVSCGIYFTDRTDRFSLLMDDFPDHRVYYLVLLPDPIPDALALFLNKLRPH